MTRIGRWRHDVRAALYRLLGIVTPTGRHLPMKRLVKSQDWKPKQLASPSDVQRLLAADLARGPLGASADVLPVRNPGTHFRATTLGALTRFSTGDPEHTHGHTSAGICGPDSGYQVNCFEAQPYVPLSDREDDAAC